MQLEFSWENKESTPDDRRNITDSKLRKKIRDKAYREANKDRMKAYREANKDRMKLQRKAYIEANRDKIKLQTKAYYEANKDKIKERNKAYCEANKDKIKTYREANKDRIKAYYEANKDKIKAYQEANRDKIKLQTKAYCEVNKDKLKKMNKAYRETNKVKLYEIKKNHIKTNIQYKLSHRLRARLYGALKGNFKAGSSVQDLGCSINELKTYLESKFQPGMTWDNWGLYGWHIDHVKPLSEFDLTNRDQFLEACHYTNLQPLWAQDNLSKSDKF